MLCAVAVCAVSYTAARSMATPWCSVCRQAGSTDCRPRAVAGRPRRVNRQTLKSLFDRLMTFNPSVELYLLSPDGDLLADAAPPEPYPTPAYRRRRCRLSHRQCVAGVWRRSAQSRRTKVFSAAPLRVDGQLRGYLYIILRETFNQLAADAWQKTLWSIVLWTLLLVALFGLLAGAGMVLGHRPVRLLTAQVAASGGTASAPSKPWRPADGAPTW